jgi:hypothetical protein
MSSGNVALKRGGPTRLPWAASAQSPITGSRCGRGVWVARQPDVYGTRDLSRESTVPPPWGEELAGVKTAQAEPFPLVLLRATDTDAKPRHPSAFHEGPMIVSISAIVVAGSGPFARAPTFSSTCATLRKPGMGNVRGEAAQIQPKAP